MSVSLPLLVPGAVAPVAAGADGGDGVGGGDGVDVSGAGVAGASAGTAAGPIPKSWRWRLELISELLPFLLCYFRTGTRNISCRY